MREGRGVVIEVEDEESDVENIEKLLRRSENFNFKRALFLDSANFLPVDFLFRVKISRRRVDIEVFSTFYYFKYPLVDI